MLNNMIILGLQDILKNKKIIFLCSFIYAFTFATVISATISMWRELEYNDRTKSSFITFQTDLIDYKISETTQIINNIMPLYQKSNFTFLYAPLKINNGEIVENIYIFFGEMSEYFNILKTDKKIALFVGNNRSEVINVIKGTTVLNVDKYLSFNQKLFDQIGLDTENNIILLIKTPENEDILNLKNIEYIYQFVANTYISNKDDMELFLNNVNGNFFRVSPITNFSNNSETKFVLTKLYPFTLCIIIANFLMSIVFINTTIKTKKKVFSIHLVCGSTMNNTIVQMVTYFVFMILLSAFLALITNLINFNYLLYFIIMGLSTIIILTIAIYISLKKTGLYNNIK